MAASPHPEDRSASAPTAVAGAGRLAGGPRPARPRVRSRHPRPGAPEAAVSDVLGSVLLVGITVVMSAILGLLLLSFDGPEPRSRVQVSVSADPGTGGWGTGDESVQLLHAGGDALDASEVTILLDIGGTQTTLSGAGALGSTWADGSLTIGETWQRTSSIAAGTPITLVLVEDSTGDSASVLSDTAIVTSTTTSTQPCTSDTTAPTVLQWTQTPATLTAVTTGSVTIIAQVTDNCWGANPSVEPSLYWRLFNGGNPAYTNQGTMSPVGSGRWAATIPAQPWGTLVGYQLQYYIGPLIDLGGNSGDSVVRSSAILLDCSSDITNPTAQSLVQNPADVRTSTTGSIAITVVAADDCSGVDETNNPHIFYRVNPGSNPAFTDGGAMTHTGTNTWTGTIPDQTWVLKAGQTLEWYVTEIRDDNGNLGTTATQQDPIDLVTTYTYVGSNTPTSGTVSAFSNMQSASDSGAEGQVQEGGTAGAPTTQTFNANSALLANGWTSSGSSFASDNIYATYSTNNPSNSNDLRVALQDPAITGTVTSVQIKAEVGITSYANDGFQLQACLNAGTCSAYGTTGGGSATDNTVTYDVTSIRPGGGTWSVSDITNLEPVVHLIQSGSRDGTWRVDRIWAEVTIQTTTYATSVRLDWSGVPTGLGVHTVELRYRVTGDTFNVEVCQDLLGVCAAWTQRGTTLDQAGITTWTYTLTSQELRNGAPRIRIVDVAPTGTTQGSLFLDYARVSSL